MTIENFATLSTQEQRSFADELLKKINEECVFTDETDFKLSGIDVDEFSGGLIMMASTADPISVTRKAEWTCATVEDVEDDPGFEANYENHIYDDANKAFKTLSTIIDGYKVTLEIHDVDALDTGAEIEVTSYSREDAGIGHYEYWGDIGYDSRPYVEVEGTITREYSCDLTFFVEVTDTTIEEN